MQGQLFFEVGQVMQQISTSPWKFVWGSLINPPPTHTQPQLCWLLNIEWLSCFEHVVQSLSSTCLFASILGATPNHIALKKRRCWIKISNQSMHIYFSYVFSPSLLEQVFIWSTISCISINHLFKILLLW